MSEARKKKERIVEQLRETFSKCDIGIITDYRGLSAVDMEGLRQRLREADIDYMVIKNTLARLAVKDIGREELAQAFDGPMAIAFGYNDIIAPARVLSEYIREIKTNLNIRGGFLGNRLLTTAEVIELAVLPSKSVLISKVLGGIQSPITTLVNNLAAPIQGAIQIIQARIKQLEEESSE